MTQSRPSSDGWMRRVIPTAGRFVVLSATVASQAAPAMSQAAAPAPEFVRVADVIPGIRLDVRYHGSDNFVGSPVDGYEAPVCLLTRPAAMALKKAHEALAAFNLQLVVFDCYRPQRAVDHFARWAADLDDTKTRAAYYPAVPKQELFSRGYIAARSGHSRGSTVDVSIEGLDMGTPFDFFDEASHTRHPQHSTQVRANRALLASVMKQAGFRGIDEEWWHFTLENEPWPDRHFDIPVR